MAGKAPGLGGGYPPRWGAEAMAIAVSSDSERAHKREQNLGSLNLETLSFVFEPFFEVREAWVGGFMGFGIFFFFFFHFATKQATEQKEKAIKNKTKQNKHPTKQTTLTKQTTTKKHKGKNLPGIPRNLTDLFFQRKIRYYQHHFSQIKEIIHPIIKVRAL